MNEQQELKDAMRDLEACRAGLKTAANDATTVQKMQSKMRWLEAKVEKLRKKSQS